MPRPAASEAKIHHQWPDSSEGFPTGTPPAVLNTLRSLEISTGLNSGDQSRSRMPIAETAAQMRVAAAHNAAMERGKVRVVEPTPTELGR